MPEQFCNRPQIHTGHNKSTGKGMAVAMPGMPLNLRLFERCREPPAGPLQGIASSHGRIDGIGCWPGFPALQLVQSIQSDGIERNGARIPVLGSNQMKLPALKVHLVPTQAVLLAHAHPSVDLEQKMGQELSEAAFAGSA